jgi:hypothetical protein
LLRGDPGADPALQKEEEALMAKLGGQTREIYQDAAAAMREIQVFSAGFQQAVKDIKPSPALGYAHEAFRYSLAAQGAIWTKRCREQYFQFLHQLLRGELTREVMAHIDMLACGEDPLRASHAQAYRQVLASHDQNCGQLVHGEIVRAFLSRQPQ